VCVCVCVGVCAQEGGEEGKKDRTACGKEYIQGKMGRREKGETGKRVKG